MKNLVKFTVITLLIAVMMTPNAYAGFPGKVFAPYIDVCLWPTPSISAYQKATSQNYFTLSFIVSDTQGRPSWGGYHSMEEQYYMGEIQAVRAAGGDIIISFGGANGQELALYHTDVDELQAAYQSVIDLYSLKWVDFDIEGMAVAERPSIDRRNKAIKGLQAANPDLKVAFCLPVLPQGLTADGLYVIQNAMDNGVRIDLVNVMAMDYGDSAAPAPEGNMGQYAIDAAVNTRQQMQAIGVEAQIGITPMIGQNDVNSERFYVSDAQILYDWATAQEQVAWMGMLSMWSGPRDNGGCPGQLSPKCSGIEQDDYAFTQIFAQYLYDENNNAYPEITITAPPNGAVFDAGADITVTAEADDKDGTIAKVAFYLNSTLAGTAAAQPFNCTLTNVGTGIHNITVVATDNAGGSTSAFPIRVFVGPVCTSDPWDASQAYLAGDIVSFDNHEWQAKWWSHGQEPGSGYAWEDLGNCGGGSGNTSPTVSITSPDKGAVFDSGSDILITADATDSDGGIAQVEFFNGNISVGVADSEPFSIIYAVLTDGTHNFTAVATDDQGASETSDVVSISVGDNTSQDCGYPVWTAEQNWTEYMVGDKRVNSGKVWECTKTAYAYWEPSGAYGHFGWKFINNCN